MLQDNLIRMAEKYQESLIDDGFEDYLDDEKGVITLFNNIIKDYKRMMKRCKKEGVDVGDVMMEVELAQEEFKSSETASEKHNLISRIKDRIICLMEICDDVPIGIDKKYRKDLFEIFKG